MAKYIVRRYGRPPDQSWWTFLRNHMPEIAAMDLFVVPTLDKSDANGANKPCYAISGPNDPRIHAAPPPSVRKQRLSETVCTTKFTTTSSTCSV